jgi:hypothetical protein
MTSRFDRVFIVTYGRSGSTLLQGLLNAIPGYRIYGENAGFLFRLQDSYEALREANRHLANPNNDNQSQPWFGSSRYDEKTVTANFRQFVDRVLFQPFIAREYRVFGFKEIRFNEIPHEKIEKYLAFVRKIYPNAAIVFNTREISEVLKSGWWRSNYWSGLPKQLAEFGEFAESYVKAHPDHAIHVRYDNLIISDRLEVRRLLEFFGETLSPEAVDAVFRGSHSYENRTLTSYLTDRVEFIRLTELEWWRTMVDEFRIEIVEYQGGYFLAGVYLPVLGKQARLFVQAGSSRVEVCATKPTPKLEEQFTAHPAAGLAGFEIEIPRCDEIHLYAQIDNEPEILAGTILPGLAGAGRSAGVPSDRGGGATR